MPILCTLLGHKDKEMAVGAEEPFTYTTTSLDDGTQLVHSAKRQYVVVRCARCGVYLGARERYQGLVIPGRSSMP